MRVYYFLILFVLGVGTLAQINNNSLSVEEITETDRKVVRKNRYSIFYVLLFLVFVFIGGFRYYIGTDFGGYYKYDYTWDEIIGLFKNLEEPILKLVSVLCRMVWNDGVCIILVSTFLITALTFYGFSKYDDNEITLLLLFYIFVGAWLFTFNGVRQALACAIVFAVTSSLDKKDFGKTGIIKIVLWCLFAYLVHKSAILLIPAVLLSRRRIDFKQLVFILACAVAIPLLFDNAFSIMDVDVENQDAAEYIYHEINPIRVAVALAPLVLLLFVNDRREFFDNENFIVNMEFFHIVLTITTMNSAYMNRITQYTLLFTIVFIVKALKRIDGNLRFVITSGAVLLYFLYWLYGMNNSHALVPFKWSFSHFGEF